MSDRLSVDERAWVELARSDVEEHDNYGQDSVVVSVGYLRALVAVIDRLASPSVPSAPGGPTEEQ